MPVTDVVIEGGETMKQIVTLLMVGVFVMTFCVSSYAQEAQEEDKGTYGQEVGYKLKRGCLNVVSCLGEVGKGINDEMQAADNQVFGALTGIFTGTGKMILRATSGIYDIVVSPIPHMPTFPVEPEMLYTGDKGEKPQRVTDAEIF